MDQQFERIKANENDDMNNINVRDVLKKCVDNLYKQFKVGDNSYKNKKTIKITNYENFYNDLLAYNNEGDENAHEYQNGEKIDINGIEFLINEIYDISGTQEILNHINVNYVNEENNQRFEYSNNNINHVEHNECRETKEGRDYRYKKYELVAEDFPKKCVFGNLYSRVDKHRAGDAADVGDAAENKSFEYLDLTGYLLYDYVHNFEKYQNNNICDKLNKILEDRILDILDFENKYIKYVKEKTKKLEFPTFTLYDVIYPNAHYIYKAGNKNFCLPVDRVICHYKNQANQIQDVPDYFDKLTLTNFIQDIFGMDIEKIEKPIQDIFIKCLHKKLLNLFTFDEQNNKSLFYGVDLTHIHADLMALFAFFVVLNEKIIKNEYDILNIELYKSFNLATEKYFTDYGHLDQVDCDKLPFLYQTDNIKNINSNIITNSLRVAAVIANDAGIGTLANNANEATVNAAVNTAITAGNINYEFDPIAVRVGAAVAVKIKKKYAAAAAANGGGDAVNLANIRTDINTFATAAAVAAAVAAAATADATADATAAATAAGDTVGVAIISAAATAADAAAGAAAAAADAAAAAAANAAADAAADAAAAGAGANVGGANANNAGNANTAFNNAVLTNAIKAGILGYIGRKTLTNLNLINANHTSIQNKNNNNSNNIKFNFASNMYKNNFKFNHTLNNPGFVNILLDNISRMGVYGTHKINTQNFIIRYTKEKNFNNDDNVLSVVDGNEDFNPNEHYEYIGKFGLNFGSQYIKNYKFCVSNNTGLTNLKNNLINLTNINYGLGVAGFFVLQSLLLNTLLNNNTAPLIEKLYFIVLKHAFAQDYIYNRLMKDSDVKNRITLLLNDNSLPDLSGAYNRNLNIDGMLLKIFKSLMIDKDTYKNILHIIDSDDENQGNIIIEMKHPYFYKHNGHYDSENVFYDVLRDFNDNYYKYKDQKKINFISNFNVKRHKIYGDNEIFQLVNNMITKKIILHEEKSLYKEEQPKTSKLEDNDKKALGNFINASGVKLGKETVNILQNDRINVNEKVKLKDSEIEENLIKQFKKLRNYGIMKGGVNNYNTDILYNCEQDVYSLLVLMYFNKLTKQKLNYYYLFTLLLKSEYFHINIGANINYLKQTAVNQYQNTMNRKYSFDDNFDLFSEKLINRKLNEEFKDLKDKIMIFNKLIYFYLFGFNCYFMTGDAQKTILGKFYNEEDEGNGINLDTQGKKLASVAKLFDTTEKNTNNLKVDYIRMMVKANKLVFQNNDYVEKRTNNINIAQQNTGNMNPNNNGYYQMSQIPQTALSSLTDGKSIAPTFLNNSGLLPYLLSRNLHTDIIKGGGEDNIFDKTVSAFAAIKHKDKKYIQQAFKNNELNPQQMEFLKLSNQINKWIEEETKGILKLIEYARSAMAVKNLKGDDLVEFKKYEKEIRENGINFDILQKMKNLHNDTMLGGQDIQNILSKLKQTEYNIQQKKNEYIEKLNDYLKSF